MLLLCKSAPKNYHEAFIVKTFSRLGPEGVQEKVHPAHVGCPNSAHYKETGSGPVPGDNFQALGISCLTVFFIDLESWATLASLCQQCDYDGGPRPNHLI